jgi:hypothetical protein
MIVSLPKMFVIALIAVPTMAVAQESNDKAGVAPLFASHVPLRVTIEAPLTTLMRDRPKDIYLDGTFILTGDGGTAESFDLKIRTRGKYRWAKKHCDFAPIRLNFRKKQVVDTILAGQDKLKLVTHCRSQSSRFEQLVLREYLAYRVLQLMTDKSFGVRLLLVDYIDTEGGDPITKPGFVIEDDDAVASRNDMQVVRRSNLAGGDLEPIQQNLVNVFQYLIGNTEYSLFNPEPDEYCCHNTDLMSATGDSPLTPLAYDFDFAGIVNAPYAQPNPRFKHTDVRERLYRGQCENNELLPETLQRFLDNREAIYGIVDELEQFNSKSRGYITRYLDSFFKHISEPKSIRNRLIDKCEASP